MLDVLYKTPLMLSISNCLLVLPGKDLTGLHQDGVDLCGEFPLKVRIKNGVKIKQQIIVSHYSDSNEWIKIPFVW